MNKQMKSESASVQIQDDAKLNPRTLGKQRFVLMIGCAAAVCIAAAAVFIAERAPAEKRTAVAGRLVMPGEAIAANDLWQASAEADLAALTAKNSDLERMLASLATDLSEIETKLSDALADTEQTDAIERELESELLLMQQTVAALQEQELPIDIDDARDEYVPSAPPVSLPAIRFVSTAASSAAASSLDAASDFISSASESAQTAVDFAADQAQVSPTPQLDHSQYLPGGTFMPAVILGGIDAPTATSARDNPYPVLLRVADFARLPNLVRRDLRECFVLAAGYGDLASERALMRTERLSCRRQDGTFFDAPVRGFIVGEDGRAGVRGRIVAKQGKFLAQSLLAGVGSGFGKLLEGTYRNDLRQSSTDDSGNRLGLAEYAGASIGAGFGSSLDRLSEYYIALADRIHPVIEIGAGRTVDIVLQAGVDLAAEPQLGQ